MTKMYLIATSFVVTVRDRCDSSVPDSFLGKPECATMRPQHGRGPALIPTLILGEGSRCGETVRYWSTMGTGTNRSDEVKEAAGMLAAGASIRPP